MMSHLSELDQSGLKEAGVITGGGTVVKRRAPQADSHTDDHRAARPPADERRLLRGEAKHDHDAARFARADFQGQLLAFPCVTVAGL